MIKKDCKNGYFLVKLIAHFSCISLAYLFAAGESLAQVIPDRTLGTENSVVNIKNISPIIPDNTLGVEKSQITFGGNNIYQINGGVNRSGNLFHSFRDFSVPNSFTAQFNNALDVKNIITRITGSNVSNIDGTISAKGTANFFLINPNGIIFGQNSSLNVGGSFVGSTANSIQFAGGGEYSAVNPLSPPLLNMNTPIGLQMGKLPNNISVNSSKLTVNQGNGISLIGGDVTLTNSPSAIFTTSGASLNAPGGNINIGGLKTEGLVDISIDANKVLFTSIPATVQLADVVIKNGSILTSKAQVGGNINIFGNVITLDNSQISAGVSQGLGTNNTQSGDITVTARNNLKISNKAIIRNEVGDSVDSKSQGNAGNIKITANNISIENGGLSASTYGNGSSGKISIAATDKISLGDNGIIRSNVEKKSTGNSGGISIQAGSLEMTGNGPQIQTYVDSFGKGRAGDINISAANDIQILGSSSSSLPALVVSGLGSNAVGRAGNIKVFANSLILKNLSHIDSGSYGLGNGGNIDVTVKDRLALFDRSNISTSIAAGGNGIAGNVQVDAKTVTAEGGARITTFLATNNKTVPGGIGSAGNITIRASDSITFSGFYQPGNLYSGLSSSGNSGSVGKAGNITLTTPTLNLSDGAVIGSETYNASPGGSITINAQQLNLNNGGIILAAAREGSSGNASTVSLNILNDLNISGSLTKPVIDASAAPSGIYTTSYGSGVGGNIQIDTSNTGKVSLTNGGFVDSTSQGTGNAGNININTKSLSLSSGSEVLTSTFGSGTGGNITVITPPVGSISISGTAPYPKLPDGSTGGYSSGLVATTNSGATGAAGKVNVTTGNLQISEGAVISARSFSNEPNAIGGKITVKADNLSLINGGQILSSSSTAGNLENISLQVSKNTTISGTDSSYNARKQSLVNLGGTEFANNVIDPISESSGVFTTFHAAPTIPLNNPADNAYGGSGYSASSTASTTTITANNSTTVATNNEPTNITGNQTVKTTIQSSTPISNIQNNIQNLVSDKALAGDTYVIEGGAIRNNNLFHSFQEFSVAKSETAQFNNPISIKNVITRVTGNNVSNIDGTIKINGDANFFLINPHGLIFGQNSVLNIGGSFTATTANSIGFSGSGEFSTLNPQIPTLSLTTIPSNLKFGITPGDITVNGSKLTIGQNQTMSLLGGNITLTSPVSIVQTPITTLSAPGGQINLIAIATNAEVNIPTDNSSIITVPSTLKFADVNLSNDAKLSVRSDTGGSVNIFARNVNFNSGGIEAGVVDGSGKANTQSGNVSINASNSFTMVNNAIIRNEVGQTVGSTSQGNSGDIKITANNILIENGGLSASTYGNGSSGKISIIATDKISLGDNGIIRSNVEKKSTGNSGGIAIQAGSIDMTGNGPQIQTYVDSFGKGRAGDINISAANDIQMLGSSASSALPAAIVSGLGSDAVGRAGNIKVSAKSLILKNLSQIEAGTFGLGNGGNIDITVKDRLALFDRSKIKTSVAHGGNGIAGNVQVDANKVTADSGARIETFLAQNKQLIPGGIGSAGDITIKASDSITFSGFYQPGNLYSGLISSGGPGSSGNAGKITLTTPTISLLDGAAISSETYNASSGGAITINAQHLNLNNGGIILAAAREGSSGNASNVSLNISNDINISGSLTKPVVDAVVAPSGIYASTLGSGVGGNIQIDTSNTGKISLTDGGLIDSTSSSTGAAGKIGINTPLLSLAGGSEIATSTSGSGVGGNIQIETSSTGKVSLTGGGLISSTSSSTGNAGKIGINTPRIALASGSAIVTSTSGTGNGGSITANANTIDLDRSSITAKTASANGGEINFTIDKMLLLRNQSEISASAAANGNGGNIFISAPAGLILAFPKENSDITASAIGGQGGKININANILLGFSPQRIDRLSNIAATSASGLQGVVTITVLANDPNKGLQSEPIPPGVPNLSRSCPGNTDSPSERLRQPLASKLVDSGKGGVISSTSDPLRSNDLWSDPRTTNLAVSSPPSAPTPTIEAAQGWVTGRNRTVILTSQPTNPTNSVLNANAQNCYGR